MYQYDDVKIRKFRFEDIPLKIEWINNPANNEFLHYDLPLAYDKTVAWFERNKDRTDRFDAVIEYNGEPAGTIGLLSIDTKNSKAEYYIAMGEAAYKGKGVATEASKLILDYGFNTLNLNRIYLFTESENVAAQRLFEKIGFLKEGLIRSDIVSHGKYVDRYAYGVLREEWSK